MKRLLPWEGRLFHAARPMQGALRVVIGMVVIGLVTHCVW
jgi:hypothetical protein